MILDDDPRECGALESGDGVDVDGILEEESLFRTLLLCVGTLGDSSELCDS